MKHPRLTGLVQIVVGVALVGLTVFAIGSWIDRHREANIPAGRSILRPPHDVNCLVMVDGTLWAGGKEGLFLFATDGSRRPLPAPLATLRFVAALLPEADGSVWLAHEDGVSRWQNGTLHHYSALAGAFPGRGLALLRRRDGSLWAGSDHALARLDGDRFTIQSIPEGIRPNEVAVLFEDSVGTLWIGDSSPRSPGLLSLDRQGFHLHDRSSGLPHPSTNVIMQPSGSSAMWVGTGFADQGGAVLIDKNAWRAVGPEQGLAGNKVRSIYEDGDGRLWFGSEYDGVAVFGQGRLAVIDQADGLAGPEVKAILEYPRQTFWLGTNGGLTRIARFDATQGDPRYPGFGGSRP